MRKHCLITLSLLIIFLADFSYAERPLPRVASFWNKVKEILMEEGSFIMRWPEKFEGNLLQLQNRYKEKEKASKEATVLRIAKIHGGN